MSLVARSKVNDDASGYDVWPTGHGGYASLGWREAGMC